MKFKFLICFLSLLLVQHTHTMQKSNDNSPSPQMNSYYGAGLFRAVVSLSTRLLNRVYNHLEQYQDIVEIAGNSVNNAENTTTLHTNAIPVTIIQNNHIEQPQHTVEIAGNSVYNAENTTTLHTNAIPVATLQEITEKNYLGLLPPCLLQNKIFSFFSNRDIDNIFINIKDIKKVADNYRRKEMNAILFFPSEIHQEILKNLEKKDIKNLKILCKDFYGLFKIQNLYFKKFSKKIYFQNIKYHTHQNNNLIGLANKIISSKIEFYHFFNKKLKKLKIPPEIFQYKLGDRVISLVNDDYCFSDIDNIDDKILKESTFGSICSLNDLENLEIFFDCNNSFIFRNIEFNNIFKIINRLPKLEEIIFIFINYYNSMLTNPVLENLLASLTVQSENRLVRIALDDTIQLTSTCEDCTHEYVKIFNTNQMKGLLQGNHKARDKIFFYSELFCHPNANIKSIDFKVHGFNSLFFNKLIEGALSGNFKNLEYLSLDLYMDFNIESLEYNPNEDLKKLDSLNVLENLFEAIKQGKLKKLKNLNFRLFPYSTHCDIKMRPYYLAERALLKLGDAIENGSLEDLESIELFFSYLFNDDGMLVKPVIGGHIFDLLYVKIISAILDNKIPNFKIHSFFKDPDYAFVLNIVDVFGDIAKEKIKSRREILSSLLLKSKLSENEIIDSKRKVFDGFLRFIDILEIMIEKQKGLFYENDFRNVKSELNKLRKLLKNYDSYDNFDFNVEPLIKALKINKIFR